MNKANENRQKATKAKEKAEEMANKEKKEKAIKEKEEKEKVIKDQEEAEERARKEKDKEKTIKQKENAEEKKTKEKKNAAEELREETGKIPTLPSTHPEVNTHHWAIHATQLRKHDTTTHTSTQARHTTTHTTTPINLVLGDKTPVADNNVGIVTRRADYGSFQPLHP